MPVSAPGAAPIRRVRRGCRPRRRRGRSTPRAGGARTRLAGRGVRYTHPAAGSRPPSAMPGHRRDPCEAHRQAADCGRRGAPAARQRASTASGRTAACPLAAAPGTQARPSRPTAESAQGPAAPPTVRERPGHARAPRRSGRSCLARTIGGSASCEGRGGSG